MITTGQYAASHNIPEDWYMRQKGDMLPKAERILIVEETAKIARHFTGQLLRIVNLGVGRGGTVHCLRAGAPEAKIYCIDAAPHRLHPDAERVLGDIELILGWTQLPTTQAKVPHGIHVLLIDGCHWYEAVQKDIEGWTPKVVKGGIVIFHDYSPMERVLKREPQIDGVRQAVDEWKAPQEWTQIASAVSVVVFKRMSQPSW